MPYPSSRPTSGLIGTVPATLLGAEAAVDGSGLLLRAVLPTASAEGVHGGVWAYRGRPCTRHGAGRPRWAHTPTPPIPDSGGRATLTRDFECQTTRTLRIRIPQPRSGTRSSTP